jgi:hypothetical protein
LARPIVEKGMLIFRGTTASFNKVENYLKGRKWEIESASEVRVVIDFVTMAKSLPKFALVCLDHPEQQAKVLPGLLSHKFNMQVIGFFEREGMNLTAVANKLGVNYVLLPPVSGPAVERIINKIRLDLDRAAESEKKGSRKKKSGQATAEDDGVIKIKERKKSLAENPLVNTKPEDLKFDEVEAPPEGEGAKKTPLIFTERNVGKEKSATQTSTKAPEQDWWAEEQSAPPVPDSALAEVAAPADVEEENKHDEALQAFDIFHQSEVAKPNVAEKDLSAVEIVAPKKSASVLPARGSSLPARPAATQASGAGVGQKNDPGAQSDEMRDPLDVFSAFDAPAESVYQPGSVSEAPNAPMDDAAKAVEAPWVDFPDAAPETREPQVDAAERAKALAKLRSKIGKNAKSSETAATPPTEIDVEPKPAAEASFEPSAEAVSKQEERPAPTHKSASTESESNRAKALAKVRAALKKKPGLEEAIREDSEAAAEQELAPVVAENSETAASEPAAEKNRVGDRIAEELAVEEFATDVAALKDLPAIGTLEPNVAESSPDSNEDSEQDSNQASEQTSKTTIAEQFSMAVAAIETKEAPVASAEVEVKPFVAKQETTEWANFSAPINEQQSFASPPEVNPSERAVSANETPNDEKQKSAAVPEREQENPQTYSDLSGERAQTEDEDSFKFPPPTIKITRFSSTNEQGFWSKLVALLKSPWLKTKTARTSREIGPIENPLRKALESCVREAAGQLASEQCPEIFGAAWFEVKSEMFSGHVVASQASLDAAGTGKLAPTQFLSLVRLKLSEELAGLDASTTTSKVIPMKLDAIDWEAWFSSKAIVKAVIKSDPSFTLELGLISFSENEREANRQTFDQQKYQPVLLSEVPAGEPLDYDVFLHLPKNDKYLHYIRRGSELEASDKEKLLERGAFQVHLKFADQGALAGYLARRQLNQSIADVLAG